MPPKLKHVAIVTRNPAQLAEFYRQLFGMTGNPAGEGGAASSVDGYVWLAVNTRPAGRQAGLDHFGFEVENVDAVEAIRARVQDDYPSVRIARRPNRGFAAFSMHDPMGQVFDVSPVDMQDNTSLYANLSEDQRHARRISHVFLRTVDPARAAQFYQDVFELQDQAKEPGDPNYYLTDGTMTLVVAPWQITDYAGSGIERPALDHLGFEVESIEAFEADLRRLSASNAALAPLPIKGRGEGEARMKLLATTCKYGTYHLSDPDGVLLDVSEHP